MISIINLHNNRQLGINEFYVGRACKHRPELIGSVLSNQFFIYSRETNIEKYEEWIRIKIEQKNSTIIDALEELYQKALLSDIRLACWCEPEDCHCRIIKEILEVALEAQNDQG